MDLDRPENSDLDFRLFRSVNVCCSELREVDGFIRCGGVGSALDDKVSKQSERAMVDADAVLFVASDWRS